MQQGRDDDKRVSRRRRRALIAAALAAGLAAAAVALLMAWRAPLSALVGLRLERALETATGCDASIGVTSWSPPGDVVLQDVVLACDGVQVASVERATARAHVLPLLRRRVHVERLEVQGLAVTLAGGGRLPRAGARGGGGRGALAVGVLELRGGSVLLRDLPGGVAVELAGLEADSSRFLEAGRLDADVRIRAARVDLPGRPLPPVEISARAILDGAALRLRDVRAISARLGRAQGEADVALGEASMSGSLEASLSAAAVAEVLAPRSPLAIDGTVTARLELRADRDGWSLAGPVAAERLEVTLPWLESAVAISEAAALLAATPAAVEVDDARAGLLSGRAEGRARLRTQERVLELTADLEGADPEAAPLSALLPAVPPLSSRLSAQVHGAVPLADPAAARGGFTLRLEADPGLRVGGLRVDAQAHGAVADGIVRLEAAHAELAGLVVDAAGRLEAGVLHVDLEAASDDLATLAAQLAPHARPVEALVRHRPQGVGRAHLSWTGPPARSRLSGMAEAWDVTLRGLPVGRVDASITVEDDDSPDGLAVSWTDLTRASPPRARRAPRALARAHGRGRRSPPSWVW